MHFEKVPHNLKVGDKVHMLNSVKVYTVLSIDDTTYRQEAHIEADEPDPTVFPQVYCPLVQLTKID